MTTTSHANCTHDATKTARATCRRQAAAKRIHTARIDAAMIAVDDQYTKALEIVELGAISRIRGHFFAIISRDGLTTYRTSTTGHCNCPAGLHRSRAVPRTLKNGKPGAEVCYHVLAARVKAASYVAA